MRVRINSRGAVDCRGAIDVPLPAISVWGQLRDFPRYAARDPFHLPPRVEGGIPRAGVAIELSHRYAGLGVRRVGRILVWREQVAYSFSDLSRRGPRHGFPHVFSYRLEPLSEQSTRVHVLVRGLWTSHRIPHWAARWWLRWVFARVLRRVRNELLLYQLWRKRRARTTHPSRTPPTRSSHS